MLINIEGNIAKLLNYRNKHIRPCNHVYVRVNIDISVIFLLYDHKVSNKRTVLEHKFFRFIIVP